MAIINMAAQFEQLFRNQEMRRQSRDNAFRTLMQVPAMVQQVTEVGEYLSEDATAARAAERAQRRVAAEEYVSEGGAAAREAERAAGVSRSTLAATLATEESTPEAAARRALRASVELEQLGANLLKTQVEVERIQRTNRLTALGASYLDEDFPGASRITVPAGVAAAAMLSSGEDPLAVSGAVVLGGTAYSGRGPMSDAEVSELTRRYNTFGAR
jgi:hypothetical protein